MNRLFYFGVFVLSVFFLCIFFSFGSEISQKNDVFFKSSLHYTTNGMKYWYSKENGGIESLVKKSYESLPCINCHVSSCDVCHKKKVGSGYVYSVKKSEGSDLCLKCHKREFKIMKFDEESNQLDVHFSSGMECMDCHNSREIHGDGQCYLSMKEPGVITTRCTDCHKEIEETKSHSIHGDKLDCKACHNRHVISCTNCHMDTLIKKNKKVSIPLYDWIYLINYNGKVTSANMQNYVVNDNETFLMFAPQHSHSVMNKGRKCDECHNTNIVRKQLSGEKIQLTWIEEGLPRNLKEVIPVYRDAKFKLIFQKYSGGKWSPIDIDKETLVHYAGFGFPLSKDQLLKMKKQQKN